MNQSNLLIRNVLVSFFRMALTVGLGLYGTRLFFSVLNKDEVGLHAVLGASATLIHVLSTSLFTSAIRNLSLSEGKQDKQEYAETANTIYVLFLLIGLVLLAIGWLASPLVDQLTIPPELQDVAIWIYWFSIVSIVQSAVFAPVSAIYSSKQALVLRETLSIPVAASAVIAALFVSQLDKDRLFYFTMTGVSIHLGCYILSACVCFWLFPESRPNPKLFRAKRLPELGIFAGWAALGHMAWDVRMKGASIALNTMFKDSLGLNAAWAASMRASSYQQSLCNAILNAVTPAVISAEGAGRRQQMVSLALAGSKYASLVSLFVTVPLILDMQLALELWIVNVPEYAAIFASVLLAAFSVNALTQGFLSAVQASGDIGRFAINSAVLTLAPLPIACVGYALGFAPPLLVWLILGSSCAAAFVHSRFAAARLGFRQSQWAKTVVVPFLIVLVIGTTAVLPIRFLLDPGLMRLLLLLVTFAVVAAPSMWFFALGDGERSRLSAFGSRLMSMVLPKRQQQPKNDG